MLGACPALHPRNNCRQGARRLALQIVTMVPATGIEPVRCYSLEPESSASANSATRANTNFQTVASFQIASVAERNKSPPIHASVKFPTADPPDVSKHEYTE